MSPNAQTMSPTSSTSFEYTYSGLKSRNQFLGYIAVLLSGYSVGTIIGWAAPADKIIQLHGIEKHQMIAIVPITYLGAAISQIYLAFRIQKLRRDLNLLFASIPLMVAWAVMGSVSNFYLYLVTRFILGLSGSFLFVITPIFMFEMMEVKIRRICLILFYVMLCLGISVMFMLGYTEKRLNICIPNVVAPTLLSLLMLYLKDSPGGYLLRNDRDGAEMALKFYRREKSDVSSDLSYFERYASSVKGETLFGDIRSAKGKKGLILLIVLHTFQQLSGINLILLYNTDIFELTSGRLNSSLETLIFGCTFLVSCIIAAPFTRKGRRTLWAISSLLMAASVCLVGAYIYVLLDYEHTAKILNWIPLFGFSFFALGFAIGVGPLPFLMINEVLPLNSRLSIGCFVVCYNCMLAVGDIVIMESLRLQIHEGYVLMFYTAVNIVSFVYGICWLPKREDFMENDIE